MHIIEIEGTLALTQQFMLTVLALLPVAVACRSTPKELIVRVGFLSLPRDQVTHLLKASSQKDVANVLPVAVAFRSPPSNQGFILIVKMSCQSLMTNQLSPVVLVTLSNKGACLLAQFHVVVVTIQLL